MASNIPSRKPRRVYVDNQPYFKGEMMECFLCGKTKQSDLRVESGWALVEYGENKVYFCPDELPGPGAGSDAYATAYERIFTELAKRFPGGK